VWLGGGCRAGHAGRLKFGKGVAKRRAMFGDGVVGTRRCDVGDEVVEAAQY